MVSKKNIIMKKICILDYGLGNIRSLYNSIKIINSDVSYYSEIKKNKNFDILFIPGVGSFNKASKILKDNGYFKIIEKAKDENIKIVGICLGMHILFSEGYEDGRSIGLNFIKGSVRKIENTNLKLPNIGWKKISIEKNIDQPFFKKFDEKKFYFVHSYMGNIENSSNLVASLSYDKVRVPAIVNNKNIFGIQFHPEKSGEMGIELLKELIKN